jgi:hypothetical protein
VQPAASAASETVSHSLSGDATTMPQNVAAALVASNDQNLAQPAQPSVGSADRSKFDWRRRESQTCILVYSMLQFCGRRRCTDATNDV